MGWDTPLPEGTAGAIERHLSSARLSTYLTATRGDLDAAVDLYRWNAAVSAALWESIGHAEVVLRNATHDALSARHAAKGRQGQWYDDPARELDQHARDDVAKAIRRAKAGASPPAGKVVAELSFGFWRYLLAKRYTALLWPALDQPSRPSAGPTGACSSVPSRTCTASATASPTTNPSSRRTWPRCTSTFSPSSGPSTLPCALGSPETVEC